MEKEPISRRMRKLCSELRKQELRLLHYESGVEERHWIAQKNRLNRIIKLYLRDIKDLQEEVLTLRQVFAKTVKELQFKGGDVSVELALDSDDVTHEEYQEILKRFHLNYTPFFTWPNDES